MKEVAICFLLDKDVIILQVLLQETSAVQSVDVEGSMRFLRWGLCVHFEGELFT